MKLRTNMCLRISFCGLFISLLTSSVFAQVPPTIANTRWSYHNSLLCSKPIAMLPIAARVKYPLAALRLRQNGRAIVHVDVDSTGRVQSVRLRESSHSAMLDSAATEGLRKMPFKPAISSEDKPVSGEIDYSVIFDLKYGVRGEPEFPTLRATMKRGDSVQSVELTELEHFGGLDPNLHIELKQEAIPLQPLQPLVEYPDVARRAQVEGNVVVQALISADGKVVRVRVLHSSTYKVLDEAAQVAVKKGKFSPAIAPDGSKTESWLAIPITFRMD